MIEAKDVWDAIKPPSLRVETPVLTDDGIVGGQATKTKTTVEAKLDRVIDAKARTVIIGYYGQEALSRILHLRTAKEQWETLKRAYLPTSRQQLSTAL